MIKICLLSYNRPNHLKNTLESLKSTNVPYDLCIIDASTNLEVLSFLNTRNDVIYYPSNVGQAMNKASEVIKQSQYAYGLITADDYLYTDFWLERLLNFWNNAPEEIKLTSLNFEPDYFWNKTNELYWYGNNQYAFIRNSLPGSNWSFRREDIDLIFPVANKTGGEDLEVCNKLNHLGYKLASLDLTDHIGEKQSAWGNQSFYQARLLTRLNVLEQFKA